MEKIGKVVVLFLYPKMRAYRSKLGRLLWMLLFITGAILQMDQFSYITILYDRESALSWIGMNTANLEYLKTL